MEALAGRAHSSWKIEEVAVANGLVSTESLREGQVLKIAVEEPYESKEKHR